MIRGGAIAVADGADLGQRGELGGGRGGGGRVLVLGGFGTWLGWDRRGRRRLSTAGPRRLAAGGATRAGAAVDPVDDTRALGNDRGEVGV